MASSIASLFGPTAEEIAYAKQEEDKLRRQQQMYQAAALQPVPEAQAGYLAGYQAGGILSGLMGTGSQLKDPRLAQSVKIRKILGDTDVSDLNDLNKVKALSQKFAEAGLPKEAIFFADRATTLQQQAIETAKLSQLTPTRYVTKDGRPVSKDAYNIYYTSDDRQPVNIADIIPDTLYQVGQAAGASATGPEQEQGTKFLRERTDLAIGDAGNAGIELANRAKGFIARKEVKDFNEALQKAFDQLQAEGKLTKEDNFFTRDWQWKPTPTGPTTTSDDDIIDFRYL